MRLLRKDKLILRKLENGYYNADGEWVEGSPKDSPLLCCVQPDYSGNKRFIEEQGVRSEDCLTIHTRTLLRTSDDESNVEADRIVYEGFVWEVAKVKSWKTLHRLSHYEVLAFRQDKDYLNGST